MWHLEQNHGCVRAGPQELLDQAQVGYLRTVKDINQVPDISEAHVHTGSIAWPPKAWLVCVLRAVQHRQ